MARPTKSLRDLVACVLACLLGASLLAAPSPRYALAGRVIHVDDGDTLVLLTGDLSKHKVRLSSIDAPESSHTNRASGRVGQPFAAQAQRLLASLVNGQTVQALCFESDRYARDVCEVFAGDVSINREMVLRGLAWANVADRGRYLRDKTVVDMEARARAERVGIWEQANAVAPWVWRERCWKQAVCATRTPQEKLN